MKKSIDHDISLDVRQKRTIVFSSEEYLNQIISNLEEIKKLEQYINSDHFLKINESANQIRELSQTHISQKSQVIEQSERFYKLMEQYNTLMTLISQQYLYWENQLSLWEENFDKKK